MAPINNNLKRAFIFVDVIIGILGSIWLILSIFSHGVVYNEPEDVNNHVHAFSILYAIGICIVIMSMVGLYGILKEKQWALILFSVGISLVSVLFLVVGIPCSIILYKAEQMLALDGKPFDEASEGMKETFEAFQKTFHCCGLYNATEWGDEIPESCLCPNSTESLMHCAIMETDTDHMLFYEEPCYTYLLFIRFGSQVWGAVAFSYLLALVLGLALAIAVLCQMRRKMITPPVTFTTHSSDSKYAQL